MLDKETRRKLRLKNYNQQRRLNNLESERQRERNYYKAHREKILKQQHEYYLKHKTKKKAYNRAYHLRKKKEISDS